MPIFDPAPDKPWEEKLFARDVEFAGKTLHLVGLCPPPARPSPTSPQYHLFAPSPTLCGPTN